MVTMEKYVCYENTISLKAVIKISSDTFKSHLGSQNVGVISQKNCSCVLILIQIIE